MRHILLFILFLCGLMFAAKAQQADTLTNKSKSDSIYRKKDSDPSKRFVPKVTKQKIKGSYPDSTHNPHTAWTRSAFVPGWGQIYNHHWWKVPAIYVGLGMLGNAIITNHNSYKEFIAVARFKQTGKSATDASFNGDKYQSSYVKYEKLSSDVIVNAKDGYFRNYEISILGFIAVWGVNVVDAYIYGKLQHSFSMDNDFSIKVGPTTLTQPMYASNFNYNFTPALKVTITLK